MVCRAVNGGGSRLSKYCPLWTEPGEGAAVADARRSDTQVHYGRETRLPEHLRGGAEGKSDYVEVAAIDGRGGMKFSVLDAVCACLVHGGAGGDVGVDFLVGVGTHED